VVVVVISLDSVFNEESMSHSVVGNIIFNCKIVNSVCCDSSIVGVMNSVTNNIRFIDISNHVEVNWVATELESLTYIL